VPESTPPHAERSDVTRRTWLAAERTWLAWWRTGLGAAAVAIGVGRLLPEFSRSARWPFRVLGICFGVLAVAVFLLGALRQQRSAAALRKGSYDELSTPVVLSLTAAGIALTVCVLAVVAAGT
jgi:uncharacterized membrane protein YidH (DUF202 family)